MNEPISHHLQFPPEQIPQTQFTPEQVERRARAIAVNAIREMRVVYGRDFAPWTDDDARRADSIFDLLHIQRAEDIQASSESYPLVALQQSAENAHLDEIEKQLDRMKKGEPAETYSPQITAKALKAVSSRGK